MSEPERSSDSLDAVLTWLAGEPGDDPVSDLALLRSHLVAAGDDTLSISQREELLDLFRLRALDISGRFRPCLLTATLPLPRDLHVPAATLIDSLLVIAEHYRVVLADLQRRWLRSRRQELVVLSGHALGLVGEACMIGAMAGAAAPFGLWQRAHVLWLASGLREQMNEAAPEGEMAVAGRQYRRLLAVSVSQPEGLTARELQWLYDYLEVAAADAVLSAQPIQPEAASYWLDMAQDSPPIAVSRRRPGEGTNILHFSPQPIARRLAVQIEWLEERILQAEVVGLARDGELLDPDTSGLPEGLTPVEVLSLLRRLRDRWVSPPLRAQQRRKHQYTVQVSAGLKAIWEIGRGNQTSIAEWLVFNESPGGYAILCVGGVDGALSAGMILALRREASQPWSICVVRWIRSDNPDQVELGLQVVSQGYTSVSIGFRGGEARNTSPALMLPPMAAVRPHLALVTHAGTYVSRRFLLVHEGEQLYVAQGRVLGLDMQTAAIELFQYEIDPYPI